MMGNCSTPHRTNLLLGLLCLLQFFIIVFFYMLPVDLSFLFNYNQRSSNYPTQLVQVRTTEFTLNYQQKEADPKEEKSLEKCPQTSPLLKGPLLVDFSIPVTLEEIKRDNPDLQPGGRYKPKDCAALQKVAVIIPFRKRDKHLSFLLLYLHPILQRQQLDYGVYVINQDGNETFNRAKLMNVGYVEALKDYDYECFVFSDVDLIAMDDRNPYRCFSQPRHLSVAVDKLGFRLPYDNIYGGVTAMSKDQFLKINGFSNSYWGWGGEDDDIFNRLDHCGMSVFRPNTRVGKYRMIPHERDPKNEDNPERMKQLLNTKLTMKDDGINSLSYSLGKVEKLDLFTRITVDVGKP